MSGVVAGVGLGGGSKDSKITWAFVPPKPVRMKRSDSRTGLFQLLSTQLSLQGTLTETVDADPPWLARGHSRP